MKCIVQNYRKSINETDFTPEQISAIWEFYVTKSLSSSSSQSRNVKEYGHKRLPVKEMLNTATITSDNIHYFTADSVQSTLQKSDLMIFGETGSPIPIDIDTPRFALLVKFSDDTRKQQSKYGRGRAKNLLKHIRNALSHGNTYFFDNGNMLLVDEYDNKTAGMILIKQKTLLDWIALIDKDENFYQI